MRKATVLFVDDEEHVLRSIDRIVIRESFVALFATGAKQALELIAAQPIDVVVSDMKMPDMDGLSLLCKVKEQHPGIVRIVLSGFSQVSQVLAAVNKGEIFRFLTKPLDDPNEFRIVIRAAIQQAELEQWVANIDAMTTAFATQLTASISAVSNVAEELRSKYANETERKQMIGRLNIECEEMRNLLHAFQEKNIPDTGIVASYNPLEHSLRPTL